MQFMQVHAVQIYEKQICVHHLIQKINLYKSRIITFRNFEIESNMFIIMKRGYSK